MDDHNLGAGSDARSMEDMAKLMVRGSGGPGQEAGAFADASASVGFASLQSFRQEVEGDAPAKKHKPEDAAENADEEEDEKEEADGVPGASPSKKAAWFDRDRSINLAKRSAASTLESIQKQVKETCAKVEESIALVDMDGDSKLADERKIADVRLALSGSCVRDMPQVAGHTRLAGQLRPCVCVTGDSGIINSTRVARASSIWHTRVVHATFSARVARCSCGCAAHAFWSSLLQADV